MDLVFCNDFSKKFVRPNVHLVILSDSFVGQVPSASLESSMCDPETVCQVVVITITYGSETNCVRLLSLLLLRMAQRQTVRLLSLLLLHMAQRQTVLGGCYYCFELLGIELTPFQMLGRNLTPLCTPSPEL